VANAQRFTYKVNMEDKLNDLIEIFAKLGCSFRSKIFDCKGI